MTVVVCHRGAPAIRPEARRPHATPSLTRPAVWLGACLILWLGSPLAGLLSGVDPALATDGGGDGATLYRELHYAMAPLAAMALLMRGRTAARLAGAGWPVLALLADAALSLLWSEDRLASLHGLEGAAALMLTAAALAAWLEPDELALALLQALAAASLLSLGCALLLPHYGVTGAHDQVGAGAEGAWRGLYLHKNVLGHVCGLAAGLLGSPGGGRLRPAALRTGGFAAALVCLLMSRSAAGALLAAVLLGLGWLPCWPRGWRMAAAGTATVVGALLLAVVAPDPSGLPALLGRDPSLSGRTALWSYALEEAGRRPWAGRGFDATLSSSFQAEMVGRFGVNHVHSAGLDLLLNLGVIGLLLWLAVLAGAVIAGAVPAGGGSARGDLPAPAPTFLLLLAGWLVSGLSEDFGVRMEGPVSAFAAVAIWGLYRLAVRPDPARRPSWRSSPALRAWSGAAGPQAALR